MPHFTLFSKFPRFRFKTKNSIANLVYSQNTTSNLFIREILLLMLPQNSIVFIPISAKHSFLRSKTLYYTTFIDEATRNCWVYPISNKRASTIKDTFSTWKAQAETFAETRSSSYELTVVENMKDKSNPSSKKQALFIN